MALQGVHFIVRNYVNAFETGDTLPFNQVLSANLLTPGSITIILPPLSVLLMSISSSAPIYYSLAANPVADGSQPRAYMDPANGREDIFIKTGENFAWIYA